MLIKSWLRLFKARVHSGHARRRNRRLVDQGRARAQLSASELLEQRALLTALVFDSSTAGPISVTNADLAGFDAIEIHSFNYAGAFGDGITIDLDNVALEYIAIDDVSISGNFGDGISIDLENVTGLQDISINTTSVTGNTGDAVTILVDGVDMDDLSVAHSTIEGATHISVTNGSVNRIASNDNVLTHTDASWDVVLDGTDVESVIVADTVIDGGISIVGGNSVQINSGYLVRNEIRGDVGDEGVLLQLADSTVNDFTIAENSEISSLTEDGILVDLNNTPGDGINILQNTFSTDPSAAVDFLIDGDTFTQPFTLTNASAAQQLISRVTLDISPTDLQFDIDATTGQPFNPLGGSDALTGLVPTVNLTDTLLEMQFNDFDPSETFQWLLDVDFIGDPGDLSPVFGNDLIGSIMTIEFTDEVSLATRTITGLLVADQNSRDAATFASSSGGAGGYGIRFDLEDSPQSRILVDQNVIEGSSAGGVLFNNNNSDVVDAYLSRNQINATQLNGVEYRLVDSSFSGGLFDNTIGGHGENGVLVDPSISISGVIEDATNETEIEITSIAHGLRTGDKVAISGVAGNVKANGVHTVTVLDDNRFLLQGVDGTGIGVDTDRHTGGGVWFKTVAGGNITDATNDGSDILISAVAHGLATGDVVTINDIRGNLAANGTHTVTVVDQDTFSLNGVIGSGDFVPADIVASGGMWFQGLTVDFQSTVNRRIDGNSFNSNALAGLRVNLPQGTVFNADIDSNAFEVNSQIGLHVRATAGTFDTNIGSNDRDINGLPEDRNLFNRNVGAGIGLEVLDSSSGSFEIRGNAFIAQLDDATTNRFNGDGITIRMEGTQGNVAGNSSLVTSIINGNVYGVDSRGNAGSGLDFFMQEETRLQVLEVSENRFLNNGDDGFKFFRRDDAVLDAVLVTDNTFENNGGDGLDFFAVNTTQDLIDFTVDNNDITNNGELGIRLRVQADARIQANMTNNVIDNNGRFGAGAGDRGGIRVEGIQQVDLLMDLTDNEIKNNLGDGIRTLGINSVTPAVVDITGVWQRNVVTGNQGDGLDQNNIVHGDYVWVSNTFDNNGGVDGGHGVSIRGAAAISIVAMANTFSHNDLNGVDLGGGFRGSNSLWPLPGAPAGTLPTTVDGIVFGDGTAPNENEIIGNGLDGILVQGGNVGLIANRIRIEENGEDGVDLEVTGSVDIEFNDVVIFLNQGDGVEFLATSGTNNNVSIIDSRVTRNFGRGVDVLNTAPQADNATVLSDIRVQGSEIKSNGFAGIFAINTADDSQLQDGPNDPLLSGGFYNNVPYLNLHILDNEIESNGNLDINTLGGVVVWVGTVDSQRNVGLFGDVSFAQQAQLAGGKIRAEMIANTFKGNFGTDVFIDAFRSTIDPPTSTGTWNTNNTPPYDPIVVWRDPLSRMDLAFRGNTGDSLDVTNTFPVYNNDEPVFKSRDRTPNRPPLGPFTSGTRDRNATRTVGDLGYIFHFDGVGLSTFRVEQNYEPVPGTATASQFTNIGPAFGFSNFETTFGGSYEWDRITLPPGSIFSPLPDIFENNDTLGTAIDLSAPQNGATAIAGKSLGFASAAGLTIDAAGDDDYYLFTAAETAAVTINVNFTHSLGNLDFELLEADGTVIATRNSTTDNESINPITDATPVVLTEGEDYILRVFGAGGDTSFNYSFDILLPVTPDTDENNDFSTAPVDLGWAGSITRTDLNIDAVGDHDFYLVNPSGSTLDVDVNFDDTLGDIDFDIYRRAANGNLTLLGSGNSDATGEFATVGVNQGDDILIDIFTVGLDVQPDYSLTVNSPLELDVFDANSANDSIATATNINNNNTNSNLISRAIQGLNLHDSNDEDWLRFNPASTGEYTVSIVSDDSQGDLDFELRTGSSILAGTDGGNFVTRTADLDSSLTYFVRVFGDANPGYSLYINEAADRFEENDSQGTAANVGTLSGGQPFHKIERLLSLNDDDYYDVTTADDGLLVVGVDHFNALGNLDVRLLSAGGAVLATATTSDDFEQLTFSATAGTTYTVHVFGSGGATNPEYALEVELFPSGIGGGGGGTGNSGDSGGGSSDGGSNSGGTGGGSGAAGSPWTVTSTADEVDADPTDATPASSNGNLTLRAAIMEANTNPDEDTIILPAGVYLLNLNGGAENLSESGDLDITSDLIIRGAGAGQTILDASDLLLLDRVLHISPTATVTLQDLTIRGGNADNGGGILNEGNLTLTRVNFDNNRAVTEGGAIDNIGILSISSSTITNNIAAGPGGAIHNSGELTLSSVSILENSAVGQGGAVFNAATGSVDIVSANLSRNSAAADGGAISSFGVLNIRNTILEQNDSLSRGGAIANSGVLNVTTARLYDNHASSRGGAIFNAGSATIYGVTIDGNRAFSRGGAIHSESGSLAAINTTLSANQAAEGGGVFAEGNVFLTNVTVANNLADFNGGGLYNGAGSTTLLNTLVVENVSVNGNDVWGNFTSQGNNLIGDATGGGGFLGTDQRGTSAAPLDANILPLANNQNPDNSTPSYILTHAIPADSLATDGGSNSVRPLIDSFNSPPLDQSFSARFIDGNFDAVHLIDVGAFEYFVYRPVADLTATPNPAAPLQDIELDASGSFHTNQDAVLTFTWDLDEDGQFDDAFGEIITHNFDRFSKTDPDGVFTVRVLVTDDANPANTSIATVDIVVDQGNRAPSANPGGPYQIDFGNDLQLDGSGSFDPDVAFGDSIVSYSWDIDGDGQYDDATGESPLIPWTTVVSLGLSPGTHSIGLRVVDSFGVVNEAQAIVGIVRVDFGDAPDTYSTMLGSNGPLHVIVDGFMLGSAVDGELDAFSGVSSVGDDTVDLDDEDGVTFGSFEADDILPVAAQFTVTASAAGKIDAWIDFNQNGVFDHPSEHLNGGTSFDVVAGPNLLTTNIPAGSAVGTTVARVRYSTAGGLTPFGRANDGEVEDHQLEVTELQDPVTPTFLRPNSPASSPVTSDLTPLFQWTAEPENFTYRLTVQTPGSDPLIEIDVSGLQSTIFVPATALPVGTYEAFITAFNRAGEASPTSAPLQFEILRMEVNVPSTSTGGDANAVPFTDDSTPEFVWTEVAGTSRYDLQVDSLTTGARVISEPNLPGDANSYVDSLVLPLGTYSATVRAFDSEGEPGDISERYIFRVTTPPSVLTPLSDFFEDAGSGRFLPEFTWTPIPGAVTYELVVDNDTTGEQRVIDEVDLLTTSFTPDSPLPVSQYTTRVRGVNVAGDVSSWSELQTFRVTTSPEIIAPTGISVNSSNGTFLRTIVADATPTFEWTRIDVAEFYELTVRPLEGGPDIHEENLTTTTFTVPTELPMGRYRAWVRARIGDGSDLQTQWSVNYDFDIGPAPILEGPDFVTYNGLPEFSWSAPLGADQYQIRLDDLSNDLDDILCFSTSTTSDDCTRFTSSNAVTPTPADILTGDELGIGRYRYWVRAVTDGGLEGRWSAPRTFHVVTRPVITGPTGRLNDSTPTIEWEAAPGAVNYQLWINDDSRDIEQVVRVNTISSTSYTLPGNLGLGTYSAWVRGESANGEFSAWSQRTTFTVATAPTVLSPTGSSFDRVPTIDWTDVPGATNYQVWVNNFTTGTRQIIDETGVTASQLASPIDLPDGEYNVWVRAFNDAGEFGFWSQKLVFHVGGRPVVEAIGDDEGVTSDATPTISWPRIGMANRYELQINDQDTGTRILLVDDITTNSFTVTSPLPEGNYRVWVRAISVAGEVSPWSVPVDFTVELAANSDELPAVDGDVVVPTDQFAIVPVAFAAATSEAVIDPAETRSVDPLLVAQLAERSGDITDLVPEERFNFPVEFADSTVNISDLPESSAHLDPVADDAADVDAVLTEWTAMSIEQPTVEVETADNSSSVAAAGLAMGLLPLGLRKWRSNKRRSDLN